MIIIHKKKLLLLSIMSFVFVFACSMVVNRIETENTVQTVAIPVTNKVIVIDARTWYSR